MRALQIFAFSQRMNEAGVCTLHAGSTVIEPETERKMEDLEQEAKMIFPQVVYALV